MSEALLRGGLAGAAALAGFLLARRSPRGATAAALALTPLLLLKVTVGHLPAAEATLFPWDAYPAVERWWFEAPACGVLGIGLWIGRASVLRRDAVLVAAGLLAVRIATGAGPLEGGRLVGRIDAEGLCFQTNPVSCGAAAAVMYLDRLGVEATEAEMAALCFTRKVGSTDAGIARGLRRKLPGRELAVSAPAYEDLRAPAVVSIRLPGRVGHAVLLERAGPEGVTLADPSLGRRTLPKAEFTAAWQGSQIRIR